VVDVLKRRLRQRGVRVDQVVAGRATEFESDFRALGIGLPEGWVRDSRESERALTNLLPGAPAAELFTSAFPVAHSRAPSLVQRRYLLVDGSPAHHSVLVDSSGSVLFPESEVSGVRLEREFSQLGDFDEVRARGISPAAFRVHCLGTHYRRPLSFSVHALRRSADVHRHLIDRVRRAGRDRTPPGSSRAVAYEQEFGHALDHDANAARALSVLTQMLHDPSVQGSEKAELASRMDALLGLRIVEEDRTSFAAERASTGEAARPPNADVAA